MFNFDDSFSLTKLPRLRYVVWLDSLVKRNSFFSTEIFQYQCTVYMQVYFRTAQRKWSTSIHSNDATFGHSFQWCLVQGTVRALHHLVPLELVHCEVWGEFVILSLSEMKWCDLCFQNYSLILNWIYCSLSHSNTFSFASGNNYSQKAHPLP